VNLDEQQKGREGGLGWVGRGLAWGFVLASLDPTQQAVQGVLCEGESRQSRLLGLVRHRRKRGQEHALFMYMHRRMAITGDDVSLDQIVPVSRDFTLEEGATRAGRYESLFSGSPGHVCPCRG